MEIQPEVLDYLHDADLLNVQIDYTPTEKTVTFTVRFHPDCGNEELDNKKVEFMASDVVLLTCTAYGYLAGQESINWCKLKVSDEIDSKLAGWYDIGGKRRPGELTLMTHTGSTWALMYGSLSVRLAS